MCVEKQVQLKALYNLERATRERWAKLDLYIEIYEVSGTVSKTTECFPWQCD